MIWVNYQIALANATNMKGNHDNMITITQSINLENQLFNR